jgi:hypothetical protein
VTCRQASDERHDQRQHQSACRRRLNPRGVKAAPPLWRMLGNVGSGPSLFAADRKSLQEAKRNDKDGRRNADMGIGWHKADSER